MFRISAVLFSFIVLSLLAEPIAHSEPGTIRVVDENQQPIANAAVLLGFEVGQPFPGNQLMTDASGLAVWPEEWKAALPVTVQAAGFVTTTLPNIPPGQQTVQLSAQDRAADIEIKGTSTNFGRLARDGKVDFALVMPALSRKSLLAFDMSSVISPHTDTIEVIGNSVTLPSNITLPEQTETYIFPIQFNKPDHRVYVRKSGAYQLTAIHGQFPLQRVINEFRAGKSIFELINYFSFIESGSVPVDVQGDMSAVNIDVGQSKFTQTTPVQAPDFSGQLNMVSLALSDNQGRLSPTDLKRFMPKEAINLKTLGDSPSVLSLLLENPSAVQIMQTPVQQLSPISVLSQYVRNYYLPLAAKQNFSRLSFSLQRVSGTVVPQFLPLIGKPSLSQQTLTFEVPQLPDGLEAVGTYALFSEVEVVGSGDFKSERRTRLWEVWSPGWLSQVELPNVNFARRSDRTYRWEVMNLARPAGSSFSIGVTELTGVNMESITHVTRNTLDL